MSINDDMIGKGVSLADLDLFDEIENVDPNADLTDTPPPPPENPAGYLATPTLKLGDNGQPAIKINNAKKPQVSVTWEIVEDGKYKGRKFFTYPSTMVTRSGTSEVDQLIKAYTNKSAAGMPDGNKMKVLINLLQTGRPLRIVGEWRFEAEDPAATPNAEGRRKSKTYVYGMKNFPAEQVGNEVVYRPLKFNPNDPNHAGNTEFRIVTYKSA